MYRIGFGVADISPTEDLYGKTGLLGYGNENVRLVTGVDELAPMKAMCLAVTDDDGKTVLIYATDTAAYGDDEGMLIAKRLDADYGVPQGCVMISANHQHATPCYINGYEDLFVERMVQAGAAALADRKAVKDVSVQTVKLPENTYNFIRNLQYTEEDGTPIPGAMNTPNHYDFGRTDLAGRIEKTRKTYESTADSTVQLVRIIREGEELPLIVSNFQAHPLLGTTGEKTIATADFVGIYRNYLEQILGCRAMYFTGPSGNIHPFSSVEPQYYFNARNYIQHGQQLAQAVAETIREDGWVNAMGDQKVRIDTRTCGYDVNFNSFPAWLRTTNPDFAGKSDAEVLKEIEEVANSVWSYDGGYTRKTTEEDLNKYGIYSKYHCKYIVIRQKNKPGDKKYLTISTLAFGDVAFVVAPYEMFDTNGMEIKAASPYPVTMIATMADMPTAERCSPCNGYLPSALGYDNGGYSVDIAQFKKGIGENLRDDFLTMLRGLKNG